MTPSPWALGIAVLLGAVQVVAAEGRPQLVVEQPLHDFGTVERGTRVEHTFQLTNRGDAELRIDHVKGSCGCTVAVVSTRDIPAGGSGQVSVTLDTARVAGPTTKIVTVYSNDPDASVTGLTLAGQVSTDLVASPSPLYLGRLRRGDPGRREVTVTPGRAGATAVVTEVEHTNPGLRTTLEPRPDGPGQRIVIEVDSGMPIGRFNDQLRLKTTSWREPEMVLPVFGSIEGDVAVLPPQVTFGVARAEEPLERELVIRNRGPRRLAVTRISVPDELVTYRLATTEDGVEYHLTLRLREGLRPGKVEGEVEILTDHPDEGRLVVPLYAIIHGRRRG